jgi:tellurite resistance protein TerC
MARKVAVLVAGSLLVGVGVAMLVLPGPGLLVIPLGLSLLATEFPWARRLLDKFRDKARELLRRARRRRTA